MQSIYKKGWLINQDETGIDICKKFGKYLFGTGAEGSTVKIALGNVLKEFDIDQETYEMLDENGRNPNGDGIIKSVGLAIKIYQEIEELYREEK